jgi:hypothetical protein
VAKRFLFWRGAALAVFTLNALTGIVAAVDEPIEVFDAHLHYN